MVLRSILRPIQRKILRPIFAAAQRIFITADPVLETNFTFQNTKTFPDDFDLSIDAILPTAATTVTLYGRVASADHYIKVLSTGFVSINIDTSIVTSTVLATKDSKQRRYGVRVVGDDFIFTEEGATIDTVTDAVAAAKSLIINVIAQSNGADFFDGTLSDPLLTDITTPSNSESWAINRAFPATTEQSSSGNNILTYVNAPASTRGPFTFINGSWQGTEIWDKGDGSANGASGGFVGSNSITVTVGERFLVVYTIVNYVEGKVAPFAGSVNTDAQSNGTFTEIITAISTSLGIIVRTNPTTLDVINMSVKRIIEIA